MKDEIRAAGDHDGIQEYDNPAPLWLLYLFYLTIVFSFWYMGYYSAKGFALARAAGEGQALSWSRAVYLEADHTARARAAAPAVEMSGRELAVHLRSPSLVSRGRSVFRDNCASCHGDQGQGNIGPNLVDGYWVHGGGPEDVLRAISRGVPEKGMPGWRPVLGRERVEAAAAYVLSIRGRKVDNPKPPEGKLVSGKEGGG